MGENNTSEIFTYYSLKCCLALRGSNKHTHIKFYSRERQTAAAAHTKAVKFHVSPIL